MTMYAESWTIEEKSREKIDNSMEEMNNIINQFDLAPK